MAPMADIVRTERLLIRPRAFSDLESCLAMDRDPMVTQYIEGPWHDPVQHRSFVLANMAKQDPFPFGYWAVTELEQEDVFLGWVMVVPMDSSLAQAEIGWRFIRQCWGQGFASEAVIRILELVTSKQPNTEVIAAIQSENHGSIRVAEKVGMSFKHENIQNGTLERFYCFQVAG